MPPSHPAASLNGERRQVWALRRDTDQPVYLEEGQADALREFAKASLRCPYPDCTIRISTRGGTKRDHFFHVNTPPHETGRESEFHLASKLMLAHWLAGRVPEGARVREEHTVKDPATRLHRRADVMVTGQSGRQVAYEVEYKSYEIADWAAKQTDYEAKGVGCLWLMGHTRARLATGPPYLVGLGENAVRVPLLAAEIAQRGIPLLVINPATREIGTLAGDVHFTRRYRGDDTTAWLGIDPLDDCAFDTKRGLVTPRMQQIGEAEEQARRAREAREAEWRRQNAALLAKQGRVAQYEAEQEATWQGSALRASFIERWGEIPEEFSIDTGTKWGVFASLPHWHGVIYEELLGARTQDFRWPDLIQALTRHKIQRHHNNEVAFKTLARWMEHAETLGWVRTHRDASRKIILFSPTGATVEGARRARQEAQTSGQARLVQLVAERAASAPERGFGRIPWDRMQTGDSIDERARTKLVILEDGTRRWVPK